MLSLDSAWLVMRLVEAYVGLGCLVSLSAFFVLAARIDRPLAESGVGVRLVLLAGGVLLWPLLLERLVRGAGAPPVERNAHRVNADRGVEAP